MSREDEIVRRAYGLPEFSDPAELRKAVRQRDSEMNAIERAAVRMEIGRLLQRSERVNPETRGKQQTRKAVDSGQSQRVKSSLVDLGRLYETWILRSLWLGLICGAIYWFFIRSWLAGLAFVALAVTVGLAGQALPHRKGQSALDLAGGGDGAQFEGDDDDASFLLAKSSCVASTILALAVLVTLRHFRCSWLAATALALLSAMVLSVIVPFCATVLGICPTSNKS